MTYLFPYFLVAQKSFYAYTILTNYAVNNEEKKNSMPFLQTLLFIIPLGLDTLGVSLSLGIRSISEEKRASHTLPLWLRTAILFALAEMTMPLIGLLIGYAASSFVSNIMHYVGALLLIGIGAWELWSEGREYLSKIRGKEAEEEEAEIQQPITQFRWGQQLLLALSISLDELAIGFSLGAITNGKAINPLVLCLLVGLQGFVMTIVGILFGRALRTRLKPLTEWSELLSAVLLVGLGVWLLVM